MFQDQPFVNFVAVANDLTYLFLNLKSDCFNTLNVKHLKLKIFLKIFTFFILTRVNVLFRGTQTDLKNVSACLNQNSLRM